jgi:hypothetical protein
MPVPGKIVSHREKSFLTGKKLSGRGRNHSGQGKMIPREEKSFSTGNTGTGKNVTKLSILSNHNAGSRATHPASSKLLKSLEEAPLSRGELRKTLSACGSIRSTESLNSSLERYW